MAHRQMEQAERWMFVLGVGAVGDAVAQVLFADAWPPVRLADGVHWTVEPVALHSTQHVHTVYTMIEWTVTEQPPFGRKASRCKLKSVMFARRHCALLYCWPSPKRVCVACAPLAPTASCAYTAHMTDTVAISNTNHC